jgi:hypothetical protein
MGFAKVIRISFAFGKKRNTPKANDNALEIVQVDDILNVSKDSQVHPKPLLQSSLWLLMMVLFHYSPTWQLHHLLLMYTNVAPTPASPVPSLALSYSSKLMHLTV